MAELPARLDQAWQEAETRLPSGWTLDGLRCASTGLLEEQRSDDWIAVAIGPAGEERTAQAPEPVEALERLLSTFDGGSRG